MIDISHHTHPLQCQYPESIGPPNTHTHTPKRTKQKKQGNRNLSFDNLHDHLRLSGTPVLSYLQMSHPPICQAQKHND